MSARPLVVGDLFCGAGGSSEGLRRVCEEYGVDYNLTAVNHWDIAIASHTANHPSAAHHCKDVDQLRYGELSTSGRLDILWSSPSCSEHSYSKGGASVDDQNRVSAWAVVREIERYRPRIAFVENVPPFRNWSPIEELSDGRMRPIKARRGETFRAWFSAIEALGYEGRWRLVNAADYGVPQTRVRFFAAFVAPGVPFTWPEPTHGKPDTLEVQRGLRKPWVAAREIIDWSLPGTSIFERDRPLSPNTIRRIEAGIKRYCTGPLADAFLVVLRRNAEASSVDGPTPTVTAGGTHIGLAQTDLTPFVFANRFDNQPHDTESPLPTIVANKGGGGLNIAEPTISPFVGANRTNNRPSGIEEPVHTVTGATGGGMFLAEPTAFVLGQHGGGIARDVDQPLSTVTTDGYVRVVEPIVVDVRHGADATPRNTTVDEPLSTLTAKNGLGIADAFIVPQNGDGTSSVDEPLRTLTATSRGVRVIEPFVVSYAERDGIGSGKEAASPHSVEEPLGTVITRDRFGVVEPFVVEAARTEEHRDGRSVDDPLGTVTGSNRFAVAEPFLTSYYGESKSGDHRPVSIEEPVPTVTTANRFGLVEPYLVAHFGEAPGQAPRTHDIDAPAPTVTHRGAGDLVIPTVKRARDGVSHDRVVVIDGVPYVLDVRFRMLQPHELAGAQGFPASYSFTGTKTAQTCQIGNAVAVDVAEALWRAGLIALGYGPAAESAA